MKKVLVAIAATLITLPSFASQMTCNADKYSAYIDASIGWYQDLADITVTNYPELEEVSQWFVEQRVNHFQLNNQAVQVFLKEESSKVATNLSVESWLKLTQQDIKSLTERKDSLGDLAKTSFNDRQSTPHPKNYELRSAFADLLSDPKVIEAPLKKYNDAIESLENIECN